MTKKKRQNKEERDLAHGDTHHHDLPTISDSLITLENNAEVPPTDMAELGLPSDMRAMERSIARFNRLVDGQELASEEEANAFLNSYLATHTGALTDTPPPHTPLERRRS